MFDTTGVSLLTFAVMVLGVLTHVLKQFIGASRIQSTITLQQYVLAHGAESIVSAACALVLWLGLPELTLLAPDLATSIGLSGKQGVLSSFACGFVANSLADVLGGRVAAVTGKNNEPPPGP